MRRRPSIAGAAWLLFSSTLAWAGGANAAASWGNDPPDDSRSSPHDTLRMSQAVVCRSIDGFENYEPLPDAAQTSDEKLLVYYRPFGYQTAFVKGSYQAHFTQDAEIRRRGEKAIVRHKKKLLEYTAKSPQPPELIYLRNTISLKELKPGDYDLTIILHDEIAKGPPATQVVKFRVIPAQDPRKKGQEIHVKMGVPHLDESPRRRRNRKGGPTIIGTETYANKPEQNGDWLRVFEVPVPILLEPLSRSRHQGLSTSARARSSSS
jgi:hypothetical protein